MNVSKNALTSEETSKYNSIFCISNTDDAITELPLKNWGYKKWGTTVSLGFPLNEDGSVKTDFYERLNQVYHYYVLDEKTTETGQYASIYPAYNYAIYDKPNGVEMMPFINAIGDELGSIKGYYTQELQIKSYRTIMGALAKATPKDETVSSLYDYLNGYIALVIENASSISKINNIGSLILELKASADYDCDVSTMLRFGLKHALGYDDSNDLLSLEFITSIINGGSINIPVNEAVTATLPEAYLTWMTISNPREGFLTTLPEDYKTTKSKLISNGVTVSGEKTFYADQAFTATATTEGYSLCFGYVSGASLESGKALTACNPYGEVTLTVPAPNGITTDCTVQYDGKDLRMTYADGMLSATVTDLNATLVFPVPVSVVVNSDGNDMVSVTVSPKVDTVKDTQYVLFASYNAQGQLTASTSAAIHSETHTATMKKIGTDGETVRIFLLDEDWVPTYSPLYLN